VFDYRPAPPYNKNKLQGFPKTEDLKTRITKQNISYKPKVSVK